MKVNDEYIEFLESIDEPGDDSLITFSQLSVLIVDNEISEQKLLREYLESPGVNIITVSHLKDALNLISYMAFSLFIIEDAFCKDSLSEVKDIFRNNDKARHIPLILKSGSSYSKEIMYDAFDVGAIDVIFSPLDSVLVNRKVNLFLEIDIQKKLLERQTELLDDKICELEILKKDLEGTNRTLTELSTKDGLTGIANRRRFDEILQQEWKRCERSDQHLSLLMIDIDYFKLFNDHYGHQDGDDVLRKVAQTLFECTGRPYDMVARYGGEEFCTILPGTGIRGAEIVANKMLRMIRALKIPHKKSLCSDIVTVSIGGCSHIPSYNKSEEDIIRCSDSALYQAKHKGRNCLVALPSMPD